MAPGSDVGGEPLAGLVANVVVIPGRVISLGRHPRCGGDARWFCTLVMPIWCCRFGLPWRNIAPLVRSLLMFMFAKIDLFEAWMPLWTVSKSLMPA